VTLDGKKLPKAIEHARASEEAVERIVAALRKGEPVMLADAKVLEAAGCWLRRNAVEVQ